MARAEVQTEWERRTAGAKPEKFLGIAQEWVVELDGRLRAQEAEVQRLQTVAAGLEAQVRGSAEGVEAARAQAEADRTAQAQALTEERHARTLAEQERQGLQAELWRAQARIKALDAVLAAARPVAKAKGAATEGAQLEVAHAVEAFDRLTGGA
jgi:hypothetical protein